jgi:hypothetical protein
MACKNTQHREMLLYTRVTRWVTSARALISWPFCCYTGSVRAAAAAYEEEGEEAAALASTFFGNNHRGNVSEG